MLKFNLLKDGFTLLNATHRERVRKQIRRKEEMQRRIMERTSFKENLIRQQEKIHEIRRKRLILENKNMGNYKRIFPSADSERQAKYEEYLAVSQNKQNIHAIQPLNSSSKAEKAAVRKQKPPMASSKVSFEPGGTKNPYSQSVNPKKKKAPAKYLVEPHLAKTSHIGSVRKRKEEGSSE